MCACPHPTPAAAWTPRLSRGRSSRFLPPSRSASGTGLGLSIAQGFAKQSGGGLHIESTPGQGTTVTLWLPVAKAPMTQAASDDRNAGSDVIGRPPAYWSWTMRSVREIVAEQLAVLGYTVLPAGSGSEALALLDDGKHVSLIVSDLSMPGIDGITLIREAQRRQPGLPAILLTGFATQGAELTLSGATRGNSPFCSSQPAFNFSPIV